MSQALIASMTTAGPPPQGVGWIDVERASRRSGLSPRSIRRLCVERWASSGLARQGSEGGKGQWLIREDADERLSRVRSPEALPFDAGELSKAQRDELARRKRVVDQWEAAIGTARRMGRSEREAVKVFLTRLEADEGVKVSTATLYRWRREYRSRGLAGLVDQRWLKRGPEAGDPFLDEVRRLYLLPGKRLSIRVCHQLAEHKAEAEGWEVRSYDRSRRHVNAIPRGVVELHRYGQKSYGDRAEPFIERDYTALETNDIWVYDHSPLDMFIEHLGKRVRPKITVAQDCRSRYIVGWQINAHEPNSDVVLEVTRAGVLDCGVPREVYFDGGKDFQSRALGGLKRGEQTPIDQRRITETLSLLGVTKVTAEPYNARAKPVERFFRTVEERFVVLFDTWCGNRPDRKPEQLAERLKRGNLPTLQEVREAFAAWLEADYHQRPHFGQGMEGRTPASVYAEHLVEKRTASRELLDFYCLRPSAPVKVTRNGVRFDGITYESPALHEHLGKRVVLRVDDQDRGSHVIVCDLEGRFICLAEPVRKLPFRATSQDVREAQRQRKAVRKQAKQWYGETRPRLAEDLPAALIRSAQEKAIRRRAQEGESPSPGPTLVPVRTPIDDQMPKLQAALRRKAAQASPPTEPEPSIADYAHLLKPKPRKAVGDDTGLTLEDVFLKGRQR